MELIKIHNTSDKDYKDLELFLGKIKADELREYRNPKLLPSLNETTNYMYEIMHLFFGLNDISVIPDDIMNLYHIHLTEGFISLNNGEVDFTTFYSSITEPKIKSFWELMARKERHRNLNFLIYLNDKVLQKHNELNLDNLTKIKQLSKLEKFVKDSIENEEKLIKDSINDSDNDIYDHLFSGLSE